MKKNTFLKTEFLVQKQRKCINFIDLLFGILYKKNKNKHIYNYSYLYSLRFKTIAFSVVCSRFFKFVSVKFSSFEQLTKLNFTQIIPVPSSYKEFQIFSKGVGWNNNNEWIFSGDDVLVSVPVKPDSAIVFITVCLLICPNFIFKTFFSLWFGDFGLKFAV